MPNLTKNDSAIAELFQELCDLHSSTPEIDLENQLREIRDLERRICCGQASTPRDAVFQLVIVASSIEQMIEGLVPCTVLHLDEAKQCIVSAVHALRENDVVDGKDLRFDFFVSAQLNGGAKSE